MGTFYLYSKLFDYRLIPRAFHVAAYMISRMDKQNFMSDTYLNIANACCMSETSVWHSVKELEEHRMIERYRPDKVMTNGYFIRDLGEGFPVDTAIFGEDIHSTDYLIYCYYQYWKASGLDVPTHLLTAQATGISRRRVIQGVAYLRQRNYL